MTEIYYTKDHEWIKIDGNVGVVGITAYASEQLGDIVFVELPEDGKIAEIGKDIAVVESVKAASEVYSPVSGKIIEINEALESNPELINSNPYDQGWIIKIELLNLEEINDLLDDKSYKELIQ